MEKQKLEIGHPLKVSVYWYDKVPEPPRSETYEGEVVGWRQSQMVIRIPNYAVLRFWKKHGLEVGNPDHRRRGFRVNISELAESVKNPNSNQEVDIDMPVMVDTDA